MLEFEDINEISGKEIFDIQIEYLFNEFLC